MDRNTLTQRNFDESVEKTRRQREREKIWDFMAGKPAPLNSAEGLTHFHFLQLVMDVGDVLVFIDIPDQVTSKHINATDCNGIAYRSQNFRVHSEKLLKLEGSKFAQMLDNEIYQARVRRRRKPPANMMEGIKYLLDLTPASEGDDLVYQMAEMSLPSGVIKWWATRIMLNTPIHLVDGHDDVCSCELGLLEAERRNASGSQTDSGNPEASQGSESGKTPAEETFTRTSPEKLLAMQARGENDVYKTPDYRNIPDYCRIRHCNSIIRVLMMIEGHNVAINSASRVWSLVAIVKIFECPSVLQDRVAEWIVCQPKFIEILPEVALRIGVTLQLSNITRMAFRVLVNELAIEEAAGTDGFAPPSRQVTVFGRRTGDVPDEMQNLIQHAARELTDRVTTQFSEFTHPDKFEFWEMKEWERLRKMEHLLKQESGVDAQEALYHLKRFMSALAYKTTRRIQSALDSRVQSEKYLNDIDHERSDYVEPRDFAVLTNILTAFNAKQRLLCSFMYDRIRKLTWVDEFYKSSDLSEDLETRGQSLGKLMSLVEDSLLTLLEHSPQIYWRPEWDVIYTDTAVSGNPRIFKRPLIDIISLGRDVMRRIEQFSNPCLRPDVEPEFTLFSQIARHMLLTLDNSREMKFLPLWAGGCDDGSGGVFEHFLPPAEMGPNGPGPAYHTGLTIPSAPPSISDSLLEDVRGMNVMGSTTAGSVDVHDSVSTVYNPNKVIAADSIIGSEEFSENNFEYQDARFEAPAQKSTTNSAVGDEDEEEMEFFDDSDDAMSEATEVARISDIDDDDDDDFKEVENDGVESMSSKSSDLGTDSDGDSVVLV